MHNLFCCTSYFLFLYFVCLLTAGNAESQPTNDDFENALMITGEAGLTTGSTVGATGQPGEPNPFNNLPLSTIWYRWQAPQTDRFIFRTCGSQEDTTLSVYEGIDLINLDLITMNANTCELQSSVAINASEGMEYFIVVDNWQNQQGDIYLSWELEPQPENDLFENAIPLQGVQGEEYGNTYYATDELGEPGFFAGQSVWYQWLAPEEGNYSFELHKTLYDATPAAYDERLAVYQGDSIENLVEATAICQSDRQVSFQAEGGTNFWIQIDGNRNADVTEGVFKLLWYKTTLSDSYRIDANAGKVSGTLTMGGSAIFQFSVKNNDFGILADIIADGAYDLFIKRGVPPTAESFDYSFTGDEVNKRIFAARTSTPPLGTGEYFALIEARSCINFSFSLVKSELGRLLQRAGLGTLIQGKVSPTALYTAAAGGGGATLYSLGNTEAIRRFQPPNSVYATSLAFSPDERYVAVGSGIGEVVIFDLFSAQVVQRFFALDTSIYHLEFSSSGDELILTGGSLFVEANNISSFFASGDTRIRIVNWENPQTESTITFDEDFEHTGIVFSLIWLEGQNLVISASFDGSIKFWNAESGEMIYTFQPHIETVELSPGFEVDFALPLFKIEKHPLKNQFLTTSAQGISSLWDIDKTLENLRPELINNYGEPALIDVADFLESGNIADIVITGDMSLSAKFSNNGNKLFIGVGNPINSLVSTNDIFVYDTETGDMLDHYSGHSSIIFSLETIGDNLISFSGDGRIIEWSTVTGDEIRTYQGHTSVIEDVAEIQEGDQVIGAGFLDLTSNPSSNVRAYDPITGQSLFSIEEEIPELLKSSSDGRYLALSQQTRILRIWEDINEPPIFEYDLALDSDEGFDFIFDIGFSFDSKYFAFTVLGPSRVILVDMDQRKIIRKIPSTDGYLFSLLGFGLNHNHLVIAKVRSNQTELAGTAINDLVTHSVRRYDITTGEVITDYPGHKDLVISVECSEDGKYLATANINGAIRVYNYESGELIRHIDGALAGLGSLNFSSDSRQLVSTSPTPYTFPDPTTKIWNTSTWELINASFYHPNQVNDARFSRFNPTLLTGSSDGTIGVIELNPPRAIVVSGGGPYPENSIALQTHELAKFTYRTLRARGYRPQDILYLESFPDGHLFDTGDVTLWDIDGDGNPDVDGEATRETLHEAITGDFSSSAGRLMIVMINHGHITGDHIAFRINPDQAVISTEVNEWLNELQNGSETDVTLMVDCCYSGRFVEDCRKSDAIAAERDRIVIASTTRNAEAVFLPAPDLTSFTQTFLGSAFMGNSLGEAWRSGARFFSAFPVANQSPRLHDGSVLAEEESTAIPRANREFFGASWAYGVQVDQNINDFFPVFQAVTPASGEVLTPGQTITLRAELLPFQQPESISAAVRPPRPEVISGEPITSLPRVDLQLVSDDLSEGQIWEVVISPSDENYPFSQEGPYRLTFTAQFNDERLSDPLVSSLTISSDPNAEEPPVRAVIAVGNSQNPEVQATLKQVSAYAFSVYLDRFQTTSDSQENPAEWIRLFSDHALKYHPKTTRRHELAAIAANQNNPKGSVLKENILNAITESAIPGGRVYVHLTVADASAGVLRLDDNVKITAEELGEALDAAQAGVNSPSAVVIIDGPGSGSFLQPLSAPGRERYILTSSAAGECAIFRPDPVISFTHRALGPLWSGQDLAQAKDTATQFFQDFLGEFRETRITPQLDANGDGISDFFDDLAAQDIYLGTRFAFAGDEASGLPFVLSGEVIPPSEPGGPATLRARLLEGVLPAKMNGEDQVFAQFAPPGLLCGEGAAEFVLLRLKRDGEEDWTWSSTISPGFLPAGDYQVTFFAEYNDSKETTRSSQPVFSQASLDGILGTWIVK